MSQDTWQISIVNVNSAVIAAMDFCTLILEEEKGEK